MDAFVDTDLTLRLESAPKGTVYLSVSWQPDKGKDFGYHVIRRLDDAGYLAVGDTKGFPEMDPVRIRRIMTHADGFLSVLPFRPDRPSKTSPFIIKELSLAVEAGLPVAIVYDSRIRPTIADDPSDENTSVRFTDGTEVKVPKTILISHGAYDIDVEESEQRQLHKLSDFLSRAISPATTIQPYSFVISRLQPDFQLPRAACVAAAEAASGIPCLCIDSHQYATNVDDTVERARLLIKHAVFVVSEISLTEENPDFDNPSRAHEIGLATAYRKKVFPVSHSPRRHPYHGLVARQLVWWDDECQLFEDLKSAIYAERASIGRHVYNRELEGMTRGHRPAFPSPRFDPTEAPKWDPPSAGRLDDTQAWIYAVSFGVIVSCVALLLRCGIGYDQTLDFAAIFAGIVTFLFSSRIGKAIHSALGRIHYLRWLVPLIAGLILAATIMFLRPQPVPRERDRTHSPTEQAASPLDNGEQRGRNRGDFTDLEACQSEMSASYCRLALAGGGFVCSPRARRNRIQA